MTSQSFSTHPFSTQRPADQTLGNQTSSEPTFAPLAFDTHIDIPWPERTPEGLPAWEGGSLEQAWLSAGEEAGERCFTLPKAQTGGLNAACLAAYVPQGPLSQEGHEAAWRRVQAMLTVIHNLGKRPGSSARLAVTAADVRRAAADGKVAVVPVVENGYAVGEDPARLEELARKFSLRYMTLTHNGHNALADAAVAPLEPAGRHGGLSAVGREMIAVMNKTGVLIDVSHAAKTTMMQASELSETPVFASHSCIRTLCDHARNLDDEQLHRLKETGGLVQITAMPPFLRKGGGGDMKDLMAHVRYAVERLGVEHVGLSSDFDGGGGIEGWRDASQTRAVTQALEAEGFDPSEIAALWGGNMLRLLEQAEKRAAFSLG